MARVTGKKANDGSGKGGADNDLRIGAVVRVGKLNTLPHIRAEKARIYRECRRREGKYPGSLEGSRLVGMLNEISSQMLLEEERDLRKHEMAQLAQQVADLRELVMAREAREGRAYVPGDASGIKSIAQATGAASDGGALVLNGAHSDADHEPRGR